MPNVQAIRSASEHARRIAMRCASRFTGSSAPAALGVIPALLIAFAWSEVAHSELLRDSGEEGRRYVKGRVLVQPRAGLSDRELDKALKPHGGKRVGKIPQVGVQIIDLPEGADEIEFAKKLSKNPHFKYAEPDWVFEPEYLVNDPYFSNQWHLPKIGTPTAWDVSIGTGITVAILDSGVDPAHPDLKAQLVPGWNFMENNSNTADVYGHGTKCAGAAAAAGNNLLGVSGVAMNTKIMPIRVTDTQGYGYSSAMASGITWAADRGVRVASLSFRNVAGSSTIISAAQYMRNKGGVVVAAGGNTGGLLTLVASSAITAVSATDSADNRTSFSSYGNYIDVAAPGSGIWTTTNGGGYTSASGTSFSTPITAGVYALMIAANPKLASSTLDSILFTTAVDRGTTGWDQYYGYGRVDAAAAVQKAKSTVTSDTLAPSASITGPTSGKVSGLVPVSVSASDDVGVTRVDMYVNGKLFASDTTAPYGFSWDTAVYADGSAQLQAKATDAAGNIGSSTAVSVTVANDTVAPTVAITNPPNGSTVSGTITVSVTANDDKAVSRLSLTIDGKEVAVVYNGGTLSYSWNTGATTSRGQKKKSPTSTTTSSMLVAKAQDPAGNVSSATAYVKR